MTPDIGDLMHRWVSWCSMEAGTSLRTSWSCWSFLWHRRGCYIQTWIYNKDPYQPCGLLSMAETLKLCHQLVWNDSHYPLHYLQLSPLLPFLPTLCLCSNSASSFLFTISFSDPWLFSTTAITQVLATVTSCHFPASSSPVVFLSPLLSHGAHHPHSLLPEGAL